MNRKTEKTILIGCLFWAMAIGALAQSKNKSYKTDGLCEGFPRVTVKAPTGYCVGLVADESHGLKFPRRLLEVAPNRFWLTDMGSWEKGQGRLLEMTVGSGMQDTKLKVLASKLDRPHGLVLGPDGKAYIAEASKIWRTSTAQFAPEPLIDGLPSDGSHPLKELAFGSGGQLFINVGSASDRCRNTAKEQPVPCPELGGAQPRAAVYLAVLGGQDWTLQSIKPWALGLRNSMALTVLKAEGKKDVVLQGENSIDYAEANAPSEEFNILEAGVHYGWPYCIENQQPAKGYEGRFDCKTTRAASALWPAHSAPLHMLIAPKTIPQPWAGQLLVAWHGYRPTGQRLMRFDVDAIGKLLGAGKELLGDWAALEGVRPMGAPTGIALDTKGRLYVVEDRNKTILIVGKAQ